MKWGLFLFVIIFFENVLQGQTLLDDYDITDSLTYSVNGTWVKNTTSNIFEAQTDSKSTPNHSYASYDLSVSISNWVLSKDYINVWFGWMDLNRASVGGWGANNYSCGMVLA
ncbi:MAG: hypothetical protein L3J54_07140, partial [Draconibacterium sp.]|nr:hypothetical protein [Draconibacterium sp.]